MFAHLFSFLGVLEQSAVVINNEIQLLLDLYVHFERLAQVHLIDFPVTLVCGDAIRVTPLDRNFSIIGGVARSQTKRCISTTKRTVGLKLECRVALW